MAYMFLVFFFLLYPAPGRGFGHPLKFFADISQMAERSAAVFGASVNAYFFTFFFISDPGHSSLGHQVTSSDLSSEKV